MSNDIPDYFAMCQQIPIRRTDCNYCRWLNITEEEQDNVYIRTLFNEHACMLYGKRLYHKNSATLHDPYICPCDECLRENCENMKPRKENKDD